MPLIMVQPLPVAINTWTQGNYLALDETANLLFSYTVGIKWKNILNQVYVLKYLMAGKKKREGVINMWVFGYFQSFFFLNKYGQEKKVIWKLVADTPSLLARIIV